MHPLLQPSRTDRIVSRAIDTAGVVFWSVLLLALGAFAVLAILGVVFGVGPAA